jgi:HK97 family phage prohead protease
MPRDLRNLPDEVTARLAEAFGDQLADPLPGFDVILPHRNIRAEDRGPAGRRIEVRADEEGNPILEGYATVYEVEYDVFGGPPWGWSEEFAAGACDKSVAEKDDTRLLINHDSRTAAGVPLGRRSVDAESLELESDKVGLFCRSTLDRNSPIVTGLVSAMSRGDIDQMSLAFRATRQEWNDDFTHRRIVEAQLFDVSVVAYPANPATFVQLRADTDPPRKAMSVRLAGALQGPPPRA